MKKGISMKYLKAAEELANSIEVMEDMFERNNLQVIQIGCIPYSEYSSSLYVFVEIESIEGEKIPQPVVLKMNIYDEKGYLVSQGESECLKTYYFSGYDTVKIIFEDDFSLKLGKRAKLFAVNKLPSDEDM